MATKVATTASANTHQMAIAGAGIAEFPSSVPHPAPEHQNLPSTEWRGTFTGIRGNI
jgi:hypothetical protein